MTSKQEAATIPKKINNKKQPKLIQKQQHENTILKYTTNKTTPANQTKQQVPQQQQVEPTKMAVMIKGELITDMNSFLRKKKAERDRKILEKSNPPKTKSKIPPIVTPPHIASSASATPNNAPQNLVERESGAKQCNNISRWLKTQQR